MTAPEPLDMAGPEPDIDELLEDAELGTRLVGYVVLAALFVAVVVVWLVTRP